MLLQSCLQYSYFIGYLNATLYRESTVILEMPQCGLGNQLFQYSAAYAFAKKTNSKLYIYLSKEYIQKANNSPKDRNFDLYKFGIKEDQLLFNSYKNEILFRMIKILRVGHVFKINQDNFFSVSSSKGKNVYFIQDNFEAFQYFREYEDELRKLFNVQHLASNRTTALIAKLSKKNAVCLHSRQGDWAAAWGDLDNVYYSQALKIISQKIANPEFYVFSDDIIKTKEKFKEYPDFHYIRDKKLLPIDDFFLLANCANIISSHSTFSWWASFLNQNQEKIVIIPFRYVKNHHILNDFNPQSWIMLKGTKFNKATL